MNPTPQTRKPRVQRMRQVAIALVLGASATLATAGSTGVALAFPPGPYSPNSPTAQDVPPGPTARDMPPGPGAIGPEF